MEAEVEILNDFAAIVHCLDVAEENAHIACLADWKDWLEREKCSSGQDLVGLLKSADSYLAAKVDSCVLGLGQVHIEGQEGKEALQSGVRLAFLQVLLATWLVVSRNPASAVGIYSPCFLALCLSHRPTFWSSRSDSQQASCEKI